MYDDFLMNEFGISFSKIKPSINLQASLTDKLRKSCKHYIYIQGGTSKIVPYVSKVANLKLTKKKHCCNFAPTW